MTKLINDFHNTETTVRTAVFNTVSAETERRVWRHLCGMDSCKCSDGSGVRGGVFKLEPWHGGSRFQIIYNHI